MKTVKSKLLVVCVVLGLLALIPGFVQTADAAKWSFHFTYPDCPGGDLEVWATQDCVRQLQLVKGYAKNCKKYVGHIPGAPYNDLIFDFYWDYWCGNHDHIKIALPNWNGSNWKLQELPPWIDAQAVGDIPPIVTVGDPNGDNQRVYIVVDPEVWRDNYSTVVIRNEYAIVDGTCPDLPGYLIGTTPITFDPTVPQSDNPFSTTLLNGTLSRDGEIELLPEPPVPPDPCFEQLTWVGPFLSVPKSSWGKVTFEINQPRGFYYLNLSVDTDGDQGYTPVIQNMSVETTGEPQMVSSFFDIFADEPGVQAPYEIRGLNYMYSIDEAPQQEPPTGEPKTATVESIPYQVGGEAEVSVGDLPELVNPGLFCVVKKSGQLPNLAQFVNQQQNLNECAPAAISNSLKYLQATGGVDSTLDTSIGTVGGQIGFTPASGTPASWYLKKQQLPYFTQHVTTRYITPPLTDAKLDDLINELNRGQDIEMDLKGHVEVLVGLRERCDGTIELDLFDDNQGDGASDPMHTSPVDESVVPPLVDGMELERFVIECPIEDEPELPEVLLPYLFLDTYDDWFNALENGLVRAMTQLEGEAYMQQLQDFHKEGESYPYDPATNPFVESTLYAHDAYCDSSHPDYGDPNLKFCDAGLVMGWGNQDGDSSSAWVVKYDEDPDLTNCIITLVVTAPQWSMLNPTNQINNVSFGLGNPLTGTGPVRSWNWACGSGPAFPIQWNTATTLTIDTSKTGTAAATPTATGYANNPAFMLTNVTWLSVDENGTWIGGANQNMPGPGGFQFLWNYWHWILVTPRTTVEKGIYKKWSQPPVVLDPNDDPPVIQGWDELSNFNMPVVADDWQCDDDRPVTDIHWWGSYFKIDAAGGGGHIPWTQPIPPALPRRFHIGIWTNIPDPNVNDPNTYSRPDLLIWENYCDNYVWNFAGYDRDPRKYPDDPVGAGGTATEPGHDEPMDATFQFTQLLSQDEWFYQEPSDDPCNPTVYWLSIAPIWDDDEPEWQWGWKTRLPKWNDDAVSITQAAPWWWPVVGSTTWVSGVPVQHPPYPDTDSVSWDVAFELTTNEPAYEDNPIPGDSNLDGVFDFKDLAITLAHWLERAPGF